MSAPMTFEQWRARHPEEGDAVRKARAAWFAATSQFDMPARTCIDFLQLFIAHQRQPDRVKLPSLSDAERAWQALNNVNVVCNLERRIGPK